MREHNTSLLTTTGLFL